ncbi:Aldedh domain-containing protein [Aphelenchoides fujianensis]|nr:Aldedh domain-containing protein [Aphelenchoides fujianensis]
MPRVHAGDVVFFRRLVHTPQSNGGFVAAVLEVGIVDVAAESKRKALEFAMNELIACAYANTSNNRESPFLPHGLNFRDKSGEISAFWFDYYPTGRRDVPQDQPGSHPSILQASPCVHLSALRLCRPDAMGKLSVPKNLLQTLHFVGGAYAAAGSKLLTTIKSANAAEVAEVARLAADAQRRWAARSWQQRGDVLREAGRLIRTNVDLLAEWEVRDNGKPIVEAEADVLSCAETFEFFSNVDLSGQHLPFAGRPSEHAYTIREPFAVVAALGVFNYPIQTATWKIAPAVACGNAIIYKPSPLAPITSVLLVQLLSQAGVPDGLVNVVQGEGATGVAICECPDVRKISFTGSVATGKKIAQQSAGQVCTNASKILVHESLLDEFTKRFVAKVERLRIGDTFDRSVHVGASISAAHLRKVLEIVDATVQAGARLLCGGKRVEVAGLEGGFFISVGPVLWLQGFGRENGKAAIGNCSQIKSVFVNASGRLEDPFPSSTD